MSWLALIEFMLAWMDWIEIKWRNISKLTNRQLIAATAGSIKQFRIAFGMNLQAVIRNLVYWLVFWYNCSLITISWTDAGWLISVFMKINPEMKTEMKSIKKSPQSDPARRISIIIKFYKSRIRLNLNKLQSANQL